MSRSSKKVIDLLREGAVHFRNDDFEQARLCWEVALELEPNNRHIQKSLALLEDDDPVSELEQAAIEAMPETPTQEDLPAVPAPAPVVAPALDAKKKTPIPKEWLQSSAPQPQPEVAFVSAEPPDAKEPPVWRQTGELELPMEGAAPESQPSDGISSSSSATHTAVSSEFLRHHAERPPVGSAPETRDRRGMPFVSKRPSQPGAMGPRRKPPTAPPATRSARTTGHQFYDGPAISVPEVFAPAEPEVVPEVEESVVPEPQAPPPQPVQPPAEVEEATTKPPRTVSGAVFAKALDSALAKEFSALLGDDVQLAKTDGELPESGSATLDATLPIIEYVREFLLRLLSARNDVEFVLLLEAFLERDLEPLMDHWPMPSEILDGVVGFYDKFTRHAMKFYMQKKHLLAYRLYLLCFCARPDDKRVQSNLDKLKKRLEVK